MNLYTKCLACLLLLCVQGALVAQESVQLVCDSQSFHELSKSSTRKVTKHRGRYVRRSERRSFSMPSLKTVGLVVAGVCGVAVAAWALLPGVAIVCDGMANGLGFFNSFALASLFYGNGGFGYWASLLV